MRAASAWLVLAALAFPVAAQTIEMSEACFPGFCVESREPFIRLHSDLVRSRFTIRVFAEDRVVIFLKQDMPTIADCAGICRLETADGLPRAVHGRTGEPMGRVFGPFAACSGEGEFHVVARVYQPMIKLDSFAVTRRC